jgi:hypothetical protein
MSGIPYISIERTGFIMPEAAEKHAELMRNDPDQEYMGQLLSVKVIGATVITVRADNINPRMIEHLHRNAATEDATAMLLGTRVRKARNGFDPSLAD